MSRAELSCWRLFQYHCYVTDRPEEVNLIGEDNAQISCTEVLVMVMVTVVVVVVPLLTTSALHQYKVDLHVQST